MLESVAFIKLVSKLKVNGHDNVSFRSCGLYIDSEDQFPRASRDGIASCDCCCCCCCCYCLVIVDLWK